jgi:hypothetical protein
LQRPKLNVWQFLGTQSRHLPAEHWPLLQTLPQVPQLLASFWRSLQVSGVEPHRVWELVQGQTVAVAVAVVVTVTEGVTVVVAGTVVKTVSVNWVVVVKSIASVTETASVRVVVVVTWAVAEARPRQPQAE